MAPYRDNARWGELRASHRVNALSWLGAGLFATAVAGTCLYFAPFSERQSMKLWSGVLVFAVLAMWMLREFARLRRIVLHRYERGFVFRDGKVEHEVAWTDVSAIRAEHVPGLRKRGAKDPGNLVTLVVTFPRGEVSIPRELDHFPAVVEEFRTRTVATWDGVTIANLMNRS